jgi:stearoyl-CoA desaturase (delta-9 desaturase)
MPTAFDRLLWRLKFLRRDSSLRFQPRIAAVILGFHLLALLACIPWLFSWSGLALVPLGVYLFGTVGINIGFHRLLTHRGFACPRWLECALTVLGVCSRQGTPLSWVAVHRMHHQHSDEDADPHTPRASFFWSHVGWFLVYDPAVWNIGTYDRYARDLLRDRFVKNLEKPRVWRRVQAAQLAVFLILGAVVGAVATASWLGALRMALSWLVWGVLVRTVVVWHITWSINSVTHVWGYRNYDTRDDSRNNLLVGLISNGEGWHNNHHAQPRAAAHGIRWWELDVAWITIWGLERLGLVRDVVRPKAQAEGEPPAEPAAEPRRAA